MKLKRRSLRKKRFRAEYGFTKETQSKSDPRIKRCDHCGREIPIHPEISGDIDSGDILGNVAKMVTLMAVTPADARGVKTDGKRK